MDSKPQSYYINQLRKEMRVKPLNPLKMSACCDIITKQIDNADIQAHYYSLITIAKQNNIKVIITPFFIMTNEKNYKRLVDVFLNSVNLN
jgi:NADPH-dependent 7-cyano-7-deazaguanine reductase QueF